MSTTQSNQTIPIDDEDESVLDIAEQTMRPKDDALLQQRIPAWHPILHPVWVIVALFYLGIIMLPVGLKIDSMQDELVELNVTYDAHDLESPLCGINTTYNAGRYCNLTFTARDDMSPPILVHYELTNFHQNHRAYFVSRDNFQLLGEERGDSVSQERCGLIRQLGNITINPCGLIANTFFNDVFTLVDGVDAEGNDLVMIEDGIAWQSDLDWAFEQPIGFRSELCPDECDSSCCDGDDWSCTEPYVDDKNDGKCYRFFYPRDDTTQYLYETYPDTISPLEGVKNEHFVVWMRVALQPNFRKLYGWIDQPISKGQEITFQVKANYVVTRFRGSKSLILSTNNIFGGKNPHLGPVFWGVGIFCLAAGTFFALKQAIRPRKLGDPAYLHFKTD